MIRLQVLNFLLLMVCFSQETNVGSAFKGCPPPFFRVLKECFSLHTTRLSWGEARKFCYRLKGDLASPESVEALQIIMQERPKVYGHQYYLGATSQNHDMEWRWNSGDVFDEKKSPWMKGEPHNGAEACLAIQLNRYPGIRDVRCSLKMPFVCEHAPNGHHSP